MPWNERKWQRYVITFGEGKSVRPLPMTPTYTHVPLYLIHYNYTYIYICNHYLLHTLHPIIFRAFWACAHVIVNGIHALYVAIKKITFKPWQKVQSLLRRDTATGAKSVPAAIRSPSVI